MISLLCMWGMAPKTAGANGPIPAFPGAEGFGANTIGGRGGAVYEVTNLDNSGPGSLRAAIEASGPRIVVFRVSGTIHLQSQLRLTNPYITIAGQTAPGEGICLRDRDFKIRQTHDVVIRYIRSRPGDVTQTEQDAISLDECRNVIIDHCSASWSIDETLSVTGSTTNNVTV
ncbi:MAG: pectate lyase, partial [Planctomycetota bacterium]